MVFFFKKNQQFIIQDIVIDHGSYNITTQTRQDKKKQKIKIKDKNKEKEKKTKKKTRIYEKNVSLYIMLFQK